MQNHLVWLRHDLRVTDNRALNAACDASTARVLVLFVATPEQWHQHDMAPRQADFLWRNLIELQRELTKLNIELLYTQVDTFDELPATLEAICQREHISDLFFNREYELNEQRRDAAVELKLNPVVRCHSFDGSLLLHPGKITTQNGEPVRRFGHFLRQAIPALQQIDFRPLQAPERRKPVLRATEHPLEPFSYPRKSSSAFHAGEPVAHAILEEFCQLRAAEYHRQRDFPALDGTSRLSPYLTMGILSPRQCLAQLLSIYPNLFDQRPTGPFAWFSELIWREFYRHLVAAIPAISQHHPFNRWGGQVIWKKSDEQLQAWQEGCTGYPLVDAAMRQMNTTGWMHNRLRMVAASFLCKQLLLDWRLGERYFMQQLIDGDLAANNGGWQWCASTGCDSAPYFRIFNPIRQSHRFDPQGKFIKLWVPELRHLTGREIHQPHEIEADRALDLEYPKPIIELTQAKKEALSIFQAATLATK